MTASKILLYVLVALCVMQAQVSFGKPLCAPSSSRRLRTRAGLPLHRDDLQDLLKRALQVGDCARVIPVSKPLPLRFRRASDGKTFQCVITLK